MNKTDKMIELTIRGSDLQHRASAKDCTDMEKSIRSVLVGKIDVSEFSVSYPVTDAMRSVIEQDIVESVSVPLQSSEV